MSRYTIKKILTLIVLTLLFDENIIIIDKVYKFITQKIVEVNLMDVEVIFEEQPRGKYLFDVILIWKKVFGDDEEFILKIINSEEYAGVAYALYNDNVVGAAHLICVEGSTKAYYCYAVATDEKYRKNGIATLVMNCLKDKCTGEGAALLLHPANSSLANYYKRLGFNILSYSYTAKIQGDGGTFSVISPNEYKKIRDFYYGSKGYYGWSHNILGMSGLKFVAFDYNGEYMAAAVRKGKICEICAPIDLLGVCARRAASVDECADMIIFDNYPVATDVAVMGYNCPCFEYFNLFLD